MLCGSVQQLVVQKLHSKLLEGLLDALGCRLYDYLFTKEKGGQATAIPNSAQLDDSRTSSLASAKIRPRHYGLFPSKNWILSDARESRVSGGRD